MNQLVKTIKILASISLILVLAGYSYAQPCVQEELIKLPGGMEARIKRIG